MAVDLQITLFFFDAETYASAVSKAFLGAVALFQDQDYNPY